MVPIVVRMVEWDTRMMQSLKAALAKILNLYERCHFDIVIESIPAIEALIDKFDDEVAVHLFGVELLDQVTGSLHGSAGSEQVVVEKHYIVLVDGVLVDFDGVDAILFGVALLYGLAGQLARLAAEYDTCVELECHC